MPGKPTLPFDPVRLRREVPAELRDLPQWVLWRVEERDGKPTKMPVTLDGQAASSTDPATWCSFEDAVAAAGRYGGAGVGFVFTEADAFCGIDLDDCRDPNTGDMASWAANLVAGLGSYAEVSPSGRGVKVFVRAEKRVQRCKASKLPWPGSAGAAIEIYDCQRYFVVTGHRLETTPARVRQAQDALDDLCALLWRPSGRPPQARARGHADLVDLTDDEIVEHAKAARNGGAFRRLWAGETSSHGNDHSSADLALCNLLAFWTGPDPPRIDRLFRQSGLMRAKWERPDYRDRTIQLALAERTEFYSPPLRATHHRAETSHGC